MRYILEIENPENIRVLVMQDLKELGIKVPKLKKNKNTNNKEDSVSSGSRVVFGNYLNLVPCLMVDECGPVPKFLVQATRILDKHIDIEGLFRKSGSVARQKELKAKIEAGDDILEANPLDVAGLIKQFFRELPDPLFTARLHDTFIKCHGIESEDARVTAVLLLCHQMSWHHLSTLRYFMLFLQKVAHNCDLNKMDIPNLAVCLTPNLMHNNLSGKSEKINTEGRLLQIQTNIVQMLILWAGDIGMVPDSLYERATLMSACFPTDDELEKSEAAIVQEQNKSKGKKKRRSGSLQGLVSNLSTSFSKWRKDSKAHNASSISDRSTMSYMSFEKSSMMSVDQTDMSRLTLPPGGVPSDEYLDPAFLEATPKMIRKRKAEDEAVPFSASKKKAILQHMPQMSALGNTPFTPATSRRGRYQGDFQETPNIKFVDAENMIFSASATPNMQTPKRKMDKLFTPYTSTKVKRQSSGKSGCFSPKTSKSNVRKSVRGFFRRLSGGKDPMASPSSAGSGGGYSDEVGQKLAGVPDSLLIMDPGAGQKKQSFFRRHKKTPSSPARLVTSLTAELQREKAAMASRGSSTSSMCPTDGEHDASFTKSELASRLGSDLNLVSPNEGDKTPIIGNKLLRGDQSLDTTNASLRRGKPNTVKSGLHEYYKRRSLDVALADNGDEAIIGLMESVPNTIDTSPILNDGGPSRSTHAEYEDLTPQVPDLSLLSRQSSQLSILSHHASKTSLLSTGIPTDAGLDQAFINESLLGDTTQCTDGMVNDTKQHGKDVTGKQVEDVDEVFPSSPAAENSPQFSVRFKCVALDSVKDQSHISAVETQTQRDSEPSVSKDSVPQKSALIHQHSVDSIDSAVDTDAGPESMSKSTSVHSLQSLQSCDSGLGIHGESSKLQTHVTHKLHLDSSLTRPESQRVRRRSAEPNLQISADMHNMLSKAGVLENSTCSVVDTSQSMDVSVDSDNKAPAALRESVLELHKAGKVSTARRQQEETLELERRRDSPLRFANSMMRRNPDASPVRIPTIFAKNDKDASHYRNLAKAALSSNTKTASIRRPNLPITTNMVRGTPVEAGSGGLMPPPTPCAEGSKTPEGCDRSQESTAGHTPARSHQAAMRVINFEPTLAPPPELEGSPSAGNNENLPQTTPKIKGSLLGRDSNYKLVNKPFPTAAVAATDSVKKYRSPMKPVKRLQGSPISPHGRRGSRSPRQATSPHRSSTSTRPHGMSPLPNQAGDWNI